MNKQGIFYFKMFSTDTINTYFKIDNQLFAKFNTRMILKCLKELKESDK